MNIKGFDKDLRCRGYQFEIGKEYKIETDKPLELCTDTVFHYCKSIQNVHKHYSCSDDNNRFCEIEVLGEEIGDDEKFGSNHIKVVREILGEELDILLGKVNGNTGIFNTGNWNTGNSNTGDRNTGNWNTGNRNTGNWNTGNRNTGNWNTGNLNTGNWNTGNWNTGDRNTGNRNTGDWNTGNWNTGDWNTGDWNTGDRNTGNWNTGNSNTGDRNTGNRNTGDWNACNYSSGFFCTKEPKCRIFNIDTDMTITEFRNSKWYKALNSSCFVLTEWVNYTDEEKVNDKEKELIGGYLKKYTYKEACQNWWDNMTEENKAIIKRMPNFNAEIFEEITGIKV